MHELIEVLEKCRDAAQQGLLTEMVEGNQIPLRQRFGPVFSRWYHLMTMFLYSAVICTELYYRANGLGSLIDADSSSVDKVTSVAG